MGQPAYAYKPVPAGRTVEVRRTSGRGRAAKRAVPMVARRMLLIGVPLALVIAYVGLTAQLTVQTYRLADDKARQTQLMQINTELHAQVGQLESLSRLEAAAAKLHMTYPKDVSVLALPGAPKPQPENTALAFVARLLHVR